MSAQPKPISPDSLPVAGMGADNGIVQLKVAPQTVPKAEVTQSPSGDAAHASANKAGGRGSVTRKLILGALLIAALGSASMFGYEWYTVGRFEVSTDDAYVKADMSQLGTRVPGYVTAIPFAENTHVKAGDVVLQLDSGDYQLAVDAAKARIETQKATIAAFDEQIAAQAAQVQVAEAQFASAQAAQTNAQATAERTQRLVQRGVSAVATKDNVTAALLQADAAVTQGRAAVAAAKAQIEVLRANKLQAEKVLAELNTALDKAQRDLTFTQVRAPYDGIVGNRAAEVGQFVQAGQRLMALVPVEQSFIEANFKETQLGSVHVGQKAKIEVDALDDKEFEGRVESISPASGAEFSLLPPENATGNFTKITQRIPVRVSVPRELAEQLRLGLSVVVTVDARDAGSN